MYMAIRQLGLAAILVTVGSSAGAAEIYSVDPVHSSVVFKIMHADISYIHGRFNDYSGKFVIDKQDPSKSSFSMSIKVDSVDTNNKQRDEHLRKPDYFDATQFPAMNFESSKVKAVDGGYDVTGEMTIHGVKKEISFTLKGGQKEVEFPKGVMRIAFATTLVVKRSEYGMKTGIPAVGDDVHIVIDVEAAKVDPSKP